MAKLQVIGHKLVTNGLTLPLLHAGPDELQGYLEALMAKLLEVVRTGNSETQYSALGAIASAANAAGTSFQPYVPAVFPVLQQYMEVRSKQPFFSKLLSVFGQKINHTCLLCSLFCSSTWRYGLVRLLPVVDKEFAPGCCLLLSKGPAIHACCLPCSAAIHRGTVYSAILSRFLPVLINKSGICACCLPCSAAIHVGTV